jgi:septum formation protein
MFWYYRAMPALILASHSPRRKKALKQIGIPFIAVDNLVDEAREGRNARSDPESFVLHLSRRKAQSVANRYPHHFILGLDTIVVINGKIIGKPQNESEAFRILGQLSGKWHEVITGLTLLSKKKQYLKSQSVRTRVKFRDLSEEQINRYIEKGESLDKAGAYGIQSGGRVLVEKIDGDFSNVVGFPKTEVIAMLKQAGIYNQISQDREQKMQ